MIATSSGVYVPLVNGLFIMYSLTFETLKAVANYEITFEVFLGENTYLNLKSRLTSSLLRTPNHTPYIPAQSYYLGGILHTVGVGAQIERRPNEVQNSLTNGLTAQLFLTF
jgi:hypothetical protein